ncbi:DUF502 domain-containing protein [Tundrisphaera lichenicola]|uniref:DUF502 domain-containing protein n=1 Tax=Tundrisphaera lichenicola TaxID=2029860 RepID=UPI003EBA9C99
MNPTPPPPFEKPPPLNEVGAIRALIDALRTRVISGLIMALPIALTFWIVYQLYLTLNNAILAPASRLVRYLLNFREGFREDGVYSQYVSPIIAIFLVIGLLYILGLLARSWFRRALDWVLLHLPIVTTIYKALSNVFESLDAQRQGNSFQRVVLVEFPHPGSKALGFVSKTLSDASTGRPILCVCVLTGVVPPAGFTLFVPEDRVTDIDWSVNQALQAILSGGITTPSVIQYNLGIHAPPTGPIVDPSGHPFPSVAGDGPA